MPSWQEHIILGAGLLRNIYGQSYALNASGKVDVAVWPEANSSGSKATFVVIRPRVNLHMAVDETGGIGAGTLAPVFHSDTNYAFPIHPKSNTLSFQAVADTGNVDIIWSVGR
jgi:lysozyme family protein